MSTRAAQFQATVRRREPLTDHLVRLVLDDVDGFTSTGVPDEWVGLVVPGQFQSRYYTVRSWDGRELVLDIVVHDVGLVTEWAMRDCVGDAVTITEPKASFDPPADAAWLLLVGDLTAMPAMARILETHPDLPAHVLAEVPDNLTGYLPGHADVTWLRPPAPGQSALAQEVEAIEWPAGEGYFWMAGESAQMRAIRKHLMREVGLASSHYDVMGYWRATLARQPRAVDPGPIWRAGKTAGKSDEQIWADYDAAREASDD
ncbi:siderophore-interacting protein [Nocardioides KLBMP 9356]|uniref:Siderophore-interacting protein n=1 Tax=Nocardioides potassii TaxID=2911371 RepID=A0ABS9HEJ4_9ACTN|nr:siderophore-interacting protein [Nocardioides potassii]MCF6379600.1 siderophore-interacting protein [Nocardioides potassii]